LVIFMTLDVFKMKVCGNCINWRPLQSYSSLGKCVACNKMTGRYDNGGCGNYARKNLSYFDFMWCMTCGTMVHKNDYDLHIGHELVPEPYIDHDLHEETYAVD